MAVRRKNAPSALTVAERTREANARRLQRAIRAERAYLDRLQRSGTKPEERFVVDWARPADRRDLG